MELKPQKEISPEEYPTLLITSMGLVKEMPRSNFGDYNEFLQASGMTQGKVKGRSEQQ